MLFRSMGDGVVCVEFHSKMNALGGDALQMIQSGIQEAAARHRALVIGWKQAFLEYFADAAVGFAGGAAGYAREQIAAAPPEQAGYMVAWDHIFRWQHYGYHTETTLSYVQPGPATGKSPGLAMEGGGRVERDGGRGAWRAVQQCELTEEVTRPERRDDRLLAFGGREDDLHRAARDDMERVAGIALVEDRLALAEAASAELAHDACQRVGLAVGEERAPAQRAERKRLIHDRHPPRDGWARVPGR